MKIDKSGKLLPGTSVNDAGTRANASKRKDDSGSTAQVDSTSVHLGAASAQLRVIESSMSSAPTVDAAKVAEIKQAISEGRFQVNPGMVADRLIQAVSDLISANVQKA